MEEGVRLVGGLCRRSRAQRRETRWPSGPIVQLLHQPLRRSRELPRRLRRPRRPMIAAGVGCNAVLGRPVVTPVADLSHQSERHLDGDHDRNQLTVGPAGLKPPLPKSSDRLLVKRPAIQRPTDANVPHHTVDLHDALQDNASLDSCPHGLRSEVGHDLTDQPWRLQAFVTWSIDAF